MCAKIPTWYARPLNWVGCGGGGGGGGGSWRFTECQPGVGNGIYDRFCIKMGVFWILDKTEENRYFSQAFHLKKKPKR